MTDHAKIGRRSRQKGAQGERDVANELRAIYPDAARGGLLQTQYGSCMNGGCTAACHLYLRACLDLAAVLRTAMSLIFIDI